MPTPTPRSVNASQSWSWCKDSSAIEHIVQSSEALIVVLDKEGCIVFLNKASERATGYDLTDVSGRSIWGLLIAPDERTAVERLFDQTVAGDYPGPYENDWLKKDLGRIRLLWSNTALTDESGRVAFVVATGLDVTAQRQAEEELRQSTARAHALFETASQAIFVVESDGHVSSANLTAAEMFGYEQAELVGIPLEELMPTRFRQGHDALRVRYLSDPQRRPMAQGLDLRALRKDGEEFPIEVGLSHVDAGPGPVTVAFVSDISKRAAAEAEARAATARIQDLASQLLIAQEEERRRIARDLHDDFTQRLALLGIELSFLDNEIGDDHESWSARIKALQGETLALTEQARRLSHELHPAALEHCGIVTALEMQCREFSEGCGIETRFIASNVNDSLPKGIATALYRITQEALRNALNHSQASAIRVYLSSDGDVVRLTVADDGCGFDLEQVRANGTSVGLTSIEERSRQIGGDFTVRSVLREGARIEVSVPLPQPRATG